MHFQGVPANFKTHTVTKLSLQKLTDIHLQSHLDSEIEENGDIKRVYIFSAIALFILLIACINYMNLSTARSVLRAKEIGIRKVVGAERKEIISQFLSESVLITWVAMALAMTLTGLILPLVVKLSGQVLSFGSLSQWQIVLPLLALPFIIGGDQRNVPGYFYVVVYAGESSQRAGESRPWKYIFQKNIGSDPVFHFYHFNCVPTTVVYQQLQYVQRKDLGFNKDHVLTMDYVGALGKQYNAFRADLLKNAAIKGVARSSYVPSERVLSAGGASILEGGEMQPAKIELKFITTDYDFMQTYGLHLAAGRNFSPAFSSDTNNFLINETAVKELGWKNPENALGKVMKYDSWTGKVIGVVKDFQSESLHQSVIPLLFQLPPDNYYLKISMKIDGHNVQPAIKTIQDTWHKYLPETPFDYTFLDQKFDQLYRSEQQQGVCLLYFQA